MQHRIRAAALVVRNDRLLLIHHLERRTSADYWLPPGGGVELSDSSVFTCAARETMEETGVTISGSAILYVREFVDHAYEFRNVEFFILADAAEGEGEVCETRPPDHDSPAVAEVGWFSREMMKNMTVYPEILKEGFWRDRLESPIVARHIGTVVRKKRANQALQTTPMARKEI